MASVAAILAKATSTLFTDPSNFSLALSKALTTSFLLIAALIALLAVSFALLMALMAIALSVAAFSCSPDSFRLLNAVFTLSIAFSAATLTLSIYEFLKLSKSAALASVSTALIASSPAISALSASSMVI